MYRLGNLASRKLEQKFPAHLHAMPTIGNMCDSQYYLFSGMSLTFIPKFPKSYGQFVGSPIGFKNLSSKKGLV